MPDAKQAGLRNVHRGMGGEIIGGTDESGAQVNFPRRSSGPPQSSQTELGSSERSAMTTGNSRVPFKSVQQRQGEMQGRENERITSVGPDRRPQASLAQSSGEAGKIFPRAKQLVSRYGVGSVTTASAIAAKKQEKQTKDTAALGRVFQGAPMAPALPSSTFPKPTMPGARPALAATPQAPSFPKATIPRERLTPPAPLTANEKQLADVRKRRAQEPPLNRDLRQLKERVAPAVGRAVNAAGNAVADLLDRKSGEGSQAVNYLRSKFPRRSDRRVAAR